MPTPWKRSERSGGSRGSFQPSKQAHALAYASRLATTLGSGKTILVNLSGRGDKDVQMIKDKGLGVGG